MYVTPNRLISNERSELRSATVREASGMTVLCRQRESARPGNWRVTLVIERPIAIYSSPYLRARQTVEPLAQHLGIAMEIVDDLRERLLAPNLNDDWQIQMQRAWHDLDYVLPGGEPSRQAQHRVLRVLDEVRPRHNTGTIVVASHGNLIALALHAMANGIGHDFWKAMPLPAVYSLERAADVWRVHGPGLR